LSTKNIKTKKDKTTLTENSKRAIDAVLFDFGGVFTGSPFKFIEKAGTEMGAKPGQISSIMFGPFDEDTNHHPWHRLERAEITLDQAVKEITALGEKQGFTFDPIELLSSIDTGKDQHDPLVEKVQQLRDNGYLTAIVTNNAVEFKDYWRKLIPVDTLFDLVIDSSEVGIRKPDPEIYHLALSQLGDIKPTRSIFLDDLPANVNAAINIGIHGILVEGDLPSTIRELDDILKG
jgi:putative hydrolase of the HAD superfamily